MADQSNISEWILLFFGLYSLAAGIGEFRQPGFWMSLFDDFSNTPSLRFLTGIICLVMGAAIYLTNPWDPGDWMSVVVTVIGGWIVIEGLAFLAFGDRFIRFAAAMMGSGQRVWAIIASVLGVAMIALPLMRLLAN